MAFLPPSPRKVSGEKRPRPQSMQEQAENERPFAYKHERRQLKGYQGLIQKEPVTKSPFRQSISGSGLEAPLPSSPSMPTQVKDLREASTAEDDNSDNDDMEMDEMDMEDMQKGGVQYQAE